MEGIKSTVKTRKVSEVVTVVHVISTEYFYDFLKRSGFLSTIKWNGMFPETRQYSQKIQIEGWYGDIITDFVAIPNHRVHRLLLQELGIEGSVHYSMDTYDTGEGTIAVGDTVITVTSQKERMIEREETHE